MPVSPADRLSPLYVEGVTCPACHEERDEESKARFAERQRQVERAALRGEQHIGRAQAQTAEYSPASDGTHGQSLSRIDARTAPTHVPDAHRPSPPPDALRAPPTLLSPPIP